MFSCALLSAVFIPNCGLFIDHPLFIDISHAPVVILVSDLSPLSAPLLMCGIAKKALHLFLNLQGSFFYPISSSLSRLLLSCKPQKERMNKKDYHKKNVSRNMELLFQTKSKFYDYSLSLVIIPQMSRQFQLLKMKTDLLYFLFFFMKPQLWVLLTPRRSLPTDRGRVVM